MATYWVYILECTDGSFYTGSTSDLERRVVEHQTGTYCGHTSARLPITVVYSQEFPDPLTAVNAERQIKKWSHAKKEALIQGEFDLLHLLASCRNETHFSRLTDAKN
jgi:putative endonuclease